VESRFPGCLNLLIPKAAISDWDCSIAAKVCRSSESLSAAHESGRGRQAEQPAAQGPVGKSPQTGPPATLAPTAASDPGYVKRCSCYDSGLNRRGPKDQRALWRCFGMVVAS
jgi:hypothetical protein